MGGVPRATAGNFFFNLDETKCGFVRSVEGGDISADVIAEPPAEAGVAGKHIGQPRYEELQLQIGFGLAKQFYEWIDTSWRKGPQPKTVSVVSVDNKQDAKTERKFKNAVITATTIPALDAAAKDPAFLTLRLSPEETTTAKGAGKLQAPPGEKQKVLIPANFRLDIDGLDCSKISKIDSFTVAQRVVQNAPGAMRDAARAGGEIEFPNLRVTLPESAAQTWIAWFDDFVLRGNNDSSKEKNGRIVFLSMDRAKEIGEVKLHGLGIFALRHPAPDGPVERVVAELYCEQMQLRMK